MAARRRRRWFAVAFVANAVVMTACNALNGAHDRFLDESDGATGPRSRDGGADASGDDEFGNVESGSPDAPTDGLTFINVTAPFTTVNGATSDLIEGGTAITAFDGGATHPIIVPVVQPAIPSDTYSVYATVRLPQDGEFGVVVGIRADGSGYTFGSKFGPDPKPYLGAIGPPDWNPSLDFHSTSAWVYRNNARFNMVVRVEKTSVAGKMWDVTLTEPTVFQTLAAAPPALGKGVGFYTYYLPGTILESMRVSYP